MVVCVFSVEVCREVSVVVSAIIKTWKRVRCSHVKIEKLVLVGVVILEGIGFLFIGRGP